MEIEWDDLMLRLMRFPDQSMRLWQKTAGRRRTLFPIAMFRMNDRTNFYIDMWSDCQKQMYVTTLHMVIVLEFYKEFFAWVACSWCTCKTRDDNNEEPSITSFINLKSGGWVISDSGLSHYAMTACCNDWQICTSSKGMPLTKRRSKVMNMGPAITAHSLPLSTGVAATNIPHQSSICQNKPWSSNKVLFLNTCKTF
jgi:hypothetical protein